MGASVQTHLLLSNSIPLKTRKKTRFKIETNDASEELAPDLYLSKRLSDILGFVKTGPFSAGDRKSEYPTKRTSYIKVFHYPVMRKIFGAVKINIKGDTGEIIPFVGGKLFVTLHFRQN